MKFAFADHGELGDPEFANLTGVKKKKLFNLIS